MTKILLAHPRLVGVALYLAAVVLCGAVIFWNASPDHRELL